MSVILPVKRLSASFLLLALSTDFASAAKKDESAKAGAVLFRDKGCTYCHGVGGVGTKKAPDLTSLAKDKSQTNEKITNQILNGGKKMPPFRDSLADEEVSQLIAYLRAKNKPVPPPADAPEPTPPSQ
jgi:mono/diheme cytochrome c family protein